MKITDILCRCLLLAMLCLSSVAPAIGQTRVAAHSEADMVAQAKTYINKWNPTYADEMAVNLVKYGLEYDIDICFLMAQAELETSFGTAGIGKPTSRRSIFGVLKGRYSSYREAIESFAQLLRRSYLTGGKTEHDLMRRYVSKSGAKFAGHPRYEQILRRTYERIVEATGIHTMQYEAASH